MRRGLIITLGSVRHVGTMTVRWMSSESVLMVRNAALIERNCEPCTPAVTRIDGPGSAPFEIQEGMFSPATGWQVPSLRSPIFCGETTAPAIPAPAWAPRMAHRCSADESRPHRVEARPPASPTMERASGRALTCSRALDKVGAYISIGMYLRRSSIGLERAAATGGTEQRNARIAGARHRVVAAIRGVCRNYHGPDRTARRSHDGRASPSFFRQGRSHDRRPRCIDGAGPLPA